MIGKKRMKRRIAQFMGLTMGLAMGLLFSMDAMAGSDRKDATLAEEKVFASSIAWDTWGNGTTAFMDNIQESTVRINGTFTYVHPIYAEGGSYSSGWKSDKSYVHISFTAPDGYRAHSMDCDHEAYYAGQSWSCSTTATYP